MENRVVPASILEWKSMVNCVMNLVMSQIDYTQMISIAEP